MRLAIWKTALEAEQHAKRKQRSYKAEVQSLLGEG